MLQNTGYNSTPGLSTMQENKRKCHSSPLQAWSKWDGSTHPNINLSTSYSRHAGFVIDILYTTNSSSCIKWLDNDTTYFCSCIKQLEKGTTNPCSCIKRLEKDTKYFLFLYKTIIQRHDNVFLLYNPIKSLYIRIL